MKRVLSPSTPLPSHSFPSPHFLPPPLLFTLPKCAQAVIMGLESSHRHTACPSVPAPSRPQDPPHTAPCCPGLMKARWLPVTQRGLWEPRRPTFPCPMPGLCFVSPADRSDLLLWGRRLASGLRSQTALATPEGPSTLLCNAQVLTRVSALPTVSNSPSGVEVVLLNCREILNAQSGPGQSDIS